MPLSTTCPECKALFRLADALAGKKVKCQKCHHIFLVPASDGATTMPGIPTLEARRPPDALQGVQPWLASASVPPPLKIEDEPVEVRMDEDEAEAPRRSREPEPASVDKPRRSTSKRREASTSGSNTGMIVGLSILLGGGLLSCLVCAGGGLALWLISLDKKDNSITVAFDAKGVFRTDNTLSIFDRFESVDADFGPKRHKVYFVQVEAGTSYQIDLMSQEMDSFLHVIDDQNKVVARDDDSGGGLNSRILLRPLRTGRYRIIVTSLGGNELGRYTLIVNRFGDAKLAR